MAISYSVNSTPIPTVSRCQWPPIQAEQQYDYTLNYSTYFDHIWLIDRMVMEDFEYLDGLKGTQLLEITSSDKDALNTQKSYATAFLQTVAGNHRGLLMENVRVEFLVKVT